jgi:hypothetical protein
MSQLEKQEIFHTYFPNSELGTELRPKSSRRQDNSATISGLLPNHSITT